VADARRAAGLRTVSVLFSEPKIPQSTPQPPAARCTVIGFSALQRAENSSIARQELDAEFLDEFQCSSASRKFLNTYKLMLPVWEQVVSVLFSEPKIPQCDRNSRAAATRARFSALQRAENSSICVQRTPADGDQRVSVLFSEPKIPQFCATVRDRQSIFGFSALQRAENSSIERARSAHRHIALRFQCSSASRKFLNDEQRKQRQPLRAFQCSSASRKFLNRRASASVARQPTVSVLFSEPKIPQFDRYEALETRR